MSVFHKRLLARLKSITVLDGGKVIVQLDDGDCCDMTGVLEVAKYINPDVSEIQVFSGSKGDSGYILIDGDWKFIDLRAQEAL